MQGWTAMELQVKDKQSYISVFVAYLTIPSSSLEQQPRYKNSISCMVKWQIYRDTEQPQEKETNLGSNFLGGSFSNKHNIRAPVHFRRESQPQLLKRWVFLKNRPIHFHINSTSVIRLIKWNQLSFFSIEINTPLPASVQCLADQIQVQMPILVTATYQMPDHT